MQWHNLSAHPLVSWTLWLRSYGFVFLSDFGNNCLYLIKFKLGVQCQQSELFRATHEVLNGDSITKPNKQWVEGCNIFEMESISKDFCASIHKDNTNYTTIYDDFVNVSFKIYTVFYPRYRASFTFHLFTSPFLTVVICMRVFLISYAIFGR